VGLNPFSHVNLGKPLKPPRNPPTRPAPSPCRQPTRRAQLRCSTPASPSSSFDTATAAAPRWSTKFATASSARDGLSGLPRHFHGDALSPPPPARTSLGLDTALVVPTQHRWRTGASAGWLALAHLLALLQWHQSRPRAPPVRRSAGAPPPSSRRRCAYPHTLLCSAFTRR
jgi:hypothetical protein